MLRAPRTARSALATLSARRAVSMDAAWADHGRPPLTKIVATIGPASEDAAPLAACVAAGMRVMRMNFSHATFDEANLRLRNIRAAPGAHASAAGAGFNLRAVLLDTRGPEIRMGGLRVCKATGNRKAKITLTTGDIVTLSTDAAYDGDGDEKARALVRFAAGRHRSRLALSCWWLCSVAPPAAEAPPTARG
jgi:hypothetical protein